MLLVAVGGVIGSLFRYFLNEIIGSDTTGVLIANVVGVAIAGFAAVYFRKFQNGDLKNFLVPGFCGGLTTFSSLILFTDKVGFSYLFETLGLSLLVISFVVPITRQMVEKKQ